MVVPFLLRPEVNGEGAGYRYGKAAFVADLLGYLWLPPLLEPDLGIDPGRGTYHF
ncbi:hypothetical protein ES708_03296 [subsurface metagenome]